MSRSGASWWNRHLACSLIAAISLLSAPGCTQEPPDAPVVVVGSKTFTESVILAEIITQLARDAGAQAIHRRDLGGSRVLFNAIQRGDLDAYPAYTGTLKHELLAGRDIATDEQLEAALAEMGLRMSSPIGLNNTYAIGVRRETAERFDLETISDLRAHPDLQMAFSTEFMDRADGWPGLRSVYNLPQQARGINHALAYRALATGAIDVTDLYSTDAEIAYYDLVTLEDDLGYFPRYDAVVLYRADLARRAPKVVESILRLEGAISNEGMIDLNERAKIQSVPSPIVASDFLATNMGITTTPRVETVVDVLVRTTIQQIILVGVSLSLAIVAGVVLGIAAARLTSVSWLILGIVGILQTIPALAMLVLLIPLSGLGARTAIAALFLYSLLPIVRNTHASLTSIPGDLRESADAIGLGPWRRLLTIDMPLSVTSILAGIKTAAVINVGTATLAALIGAGGYGQPILTGIRLDDFGLILQGAVPAAAMAIGMQVIFDALERLITPGGLRA